MLIGAAACLAAAPAEAHVGIADADSFYGGALHALTDQEVIPALLAIGLLAGQADGERGVLAALTAVAAVLVAGLTGWPPPMSATVLAATLVPALLVVAELRLPLPALLMVAGATGAVVGAQQGVALGRPLPVAGAAVGIALPLLYLAAITARIGARWFRIGVRIAGSWLAAIMLMLLGLAWR